MLRNVFTLTSIILLVVVMGCSAQRHNPISPAENDGKNIEINTDSQIPIIVSSVDSKGALTSGLATLGIYHGYLNFETLEAELTPLRVSNQNGRNDSLLVDITTFLTVSPCTDCVHLKSVSMDSYNRPVLSIGISHPFPPGSPQNPPSTSNRLDLHVFSVRGFIISDGITGGGALDFPKLGVKVGAFRLANAKGYAGEFDDEWDKIFDTWATIHPFIQHYDDYSVGNYGSNYENGFQNPALPTGNTVMRMGALHDYKDYVFNILPSSTETLEFLYAVTVSFGQSAVGKSEYLDPTYRVPLYCSKPPTLLRLGTIDNKLDDVNPTSYADLTIEALDINWGTAVGTNIDNMDFDSSIKSISIECPDLSTDPFIVDDASTVFQGGSNRLITNPLKYKVRITNPKLAAPAEYTGLIKVLDAYPIDANINLGGKNAVPPLKYWEDPTKNLMQVDEWATYCLFKYNVALGNRPPVCEVKLQQTTILGGATAFAYPSTNTKDPDGSIILYEYDKDYDGETFNVDASNTNGNPVELGPYNNESGSDKKFTIAMRVTDNNNPGANSVCTVELTVQHFSPLIFFDDFNNNSNGWQFDPEIFWGIKDGFLGSSAGDGAAAYGLGCYADDMGENDRTATSKAFEIPLMPSGYTSIRVTIVHAYRTEIFPFNPFEFTDDCDLWVKPTGTERYKLFTTSGHLYNTNPITSKDGPSFAGTGGVVPVFGEPFQGVTSVFDNPSLAGTNFKFKFRQQTDDGIDNCRGGWWIDSIKVEFVR